MANTVSFKIKIEGSNEIKQISMDSKELAKAFNDVQTQVKGLKGELLNLSSVVQLVEGASSAIGQLSSLLSEYTSAYTQQETAEARLAQAMRNTMGATDEEIQSIKDLASAQQKIGIVGDEVQLAAAQELATYLELSDSLKTIIPVMNDMVAQQLGLGASAESATQIATMLGKVMNGQTEALSRYGYKFDDAQKYILKYGDESERAAILAEVVEQSVAGMNEAMANTPSGKMQQTANNIGDIKEKIGKAVQSVMPFISVLAELTMAVSGVLKLAAAFQALGLKQLFAKVQSLGLIAVQKTQAIAARILGVSELQAATATGVLKTQIVALQAAMTLGLAVAITAIVTLLTHLSNRSNEAADGIENVSKAGNAYKEAAAEARAETAADIVALEDLIKSKGREGDKVAELNQKYGEAFGTYSSAAEWYDILTSKSKQYCQQLAYEAMAAQYKDELAEALKAEAEAQKALDNTPKYKKVTVIDEVSDFDSTGTSTHEETSTKVNKAWTKADKALKDASAAVADVTGKMEGAMKKARELSEEIHAGGEAATESWKTMNLTDLEKAIKDQQAIIRDNAGKDEEKAKAAANTLKQMESRANALKAAYGLESSSSGTSKDKFDGSALIENAQTYKELGNNVKYYQNKLEELKPTETELIQKYSEEIAKAQEKQAALKAVQDAAGIPTELNSLENINKAISYQQSLRQKASKEDIAGIDAEIERLNTLKTVFETGFDPSGTKAPETYAQLEASLHYYQDKLKDATAENRLSIQAHINDLEDLRKQWDEVTAELKAPGEISTLNNIESLDDAISYYQAKQKKASAEEIAGIQQTILALQAKRDMMGSILSLPEAQSELARLDGMSGKQLKLELDIIGVDGIKDKIRSLQKLLDDTKNPLDDSQRAQVESLIASYTGYQQILQKSNATFAEGWSGIKGMGEGVKNLTEILKGDGDAWEKVTGIIDGTLSLYKSFQSIIDIIQMLTTVTNAHTMAKRIEGSAAMTEAAQEGAAGATVMGINAGVTASEKAKTTAQTGSAVSGVMAAHSSIPFVGWAMGLAAAGAIIALMLSLPKFAKGGIAYGPTLGLFGEYAGAANNPEVVAPLDRLRTLVGANGGIGGKVKFKIRGRDLVGIIEKEQHINSRVG